MAQGDGYAKLQIAIHNLETEHVITERKKKQTRNEKKASYYGRVKALEQPFDSNIGPNPAHF